MKNIPENIDWSLMMKVLSSNSTSKENDQFEDWVKTDSANELFFIKAKEIWIQSKKDVVDTNAALNAVKSKVKTQSTSIPSVTIDQHWMNPAWNRFAKIAASLIFLVASVYMIYDQSDKLSTQPISVSTGLNERLHITLPDSSKVFLNSGSKISYPEKFTRDGRNVTLEGEAYFDVIPNPEKPFIITTQNTETVVLGTSFSVKAYPNEDIEEVIVETGSVSFGNSNIQKNIVLMPGDKGAYTKTKRTFTKLKNLTNNHMSWKTRVVEFNKESLVTVFNTLEKIYFISFDTKSATIDNCMLTARFNNQSLKSIIEALEMTFDLKIIKEESIYIVYGQGCK